LRAHFASRESIGGIRFFKAMKNADDFLHPVILLHCNTTGEMAAAKAWGIPSFQAGKLGACDGRRGDSGRQNCCCEAIRPITAYEVPIRIQEMYLREDSV
jgi:hypothetical protein